MINRSIYLIIIFCVFLYPEVSITYLLASRSFCCIFSGYSNVSLLPRRLNRA